jgi:WD40 repeat protein
VNTVAATSDGSTAISAGFDRTARIWDLTKPNDPATIIDHDDIVWRVAISPDDSKFATASQDGTVRLFNIDGTPIAATPPVEPGGVMGVAFLTSGQIVYTTGTADGNKDIKVWTLP